MMIGLRLRTLTRPSLSSAASQCIRQQPSRRWPGLSVQEAIVRQRRHRSGRGYRSGPSFYNSAMALWKQHPVQVPLAFAAICASFLGIIYANYYYQTQIIAPYIKFPEEVAKKLRRAVYYARIDVQPKLSMKYFKQALEVADEMGMDPFSEEIIGVKLRIAEFMERIEQYPKAIQVLEILNADCLRWLDQLGDKHWNDGKRTRIMQKTVQINIKLGELYGSPYVWDREAAEERLVWAVETAMKEQQRRQKEGVKEGEGDWLGPEEMGGAFEELGTLYEGKNQHYLATPLFLQALNLCPPGSCHSVVLMNNLATSLAQQVPRAESRGQVTRAALVDNARQWAKKAIEVAAKIQPPERTEECDVGCAVATHNLGEFAEMDGRIEEARERYVKARSLARGVGFEEGVKNAEAGLKRVGGD